MTHTTCVGANATVTMAGFGTVTVSHSHGIAFTCGRYRVRLQTVSLKHDRNVLRNLLAEERAVEKGRQRLLLSTSYSRERKFGKIRRQVFVSASRMESAVSNTNHPSDTIITPYVVQEGDTLTSIAKKSRTSVRLIADANSIADVDVLLSGQRLQIPTKSEAYEMPARPAVGADEFPVAWVYDSSSSNRIGVKALKLEGRRLAASVQSALSFNLPKLAVPEVAILLIAPLVGFCIRWISFRRTFDGSIRMDRQEAKEEVESVTLEESHSSQTSQLQNILEENTEGVEASSSPSPEAPATTNGSVGGNERTQDANEQIEDASVVEMTADNTRSESDEEIV